METNIARKGMKEWEELAFGSEEDDKYNRTIGKKRGEEEYAVWNTVLPKPTTYLYGHLNLG